MQNKYFGDVGDYGKYALLKYILKLNKVLGIHWCLVEDETKKSDGELRKYLKENKNSKLNPELFKILNKIISRDVSEIETFLSGACFFKDVLSDPNKAIYYENKSLDALSKSDIVFFDPDNGLQIKSMTKKNMFKFVSDDLLKKYWNQNKSLIIYQHYDRDPKYLDKKITQIYEKILISNFHGKILVVDSFRGTRRSYFFVLNERDMHISDNVKDFVSQNDEWFKIVKEI